MQTQKQALQGILTSRPGMSGNSGTPGLHRLGLGESRDGELFVPQAADRLACPLIVLLDGAGADAANIITLLEGQAGEEGCVLLAPDARKHTWDFLIDGFGPDVTFLDRALAQTFARCRIDRSRVAIAGFSDGASYALTLGLANGDLFTHIIAFSPGFMAPPRIAGSPGIFISHGLQDRVLPIERCSHLLLKQLEHLKLHVTYLEFEGAHTVPGPVANQAISWFLRPSL